MPQTCETWDIKWWGVGMDERKCIKMGMDGKDIDTLPNVK